MPIPKVTSKIMANRRASVKLGLIAAEIALGGIIAYNIATAPPNSSISPVNIFTPKEIPGATVTSDSIVNPPDKLTVTLKPGGGTYSKNITVKMSSNVPCKMFWNAHGKDPRKYGEPYTGPITLAAPEGQNSKYQMRFYGVHEYGIQTGIGSADFLIQRSLEGIFNQIGQDEAKYRDVQGVCSNASCFTRLGYGDCWADAEYLYNRLNGAGIPARIMAYKGRGYGAGYRHTWIQYNLGDGFKEFPYRRWGGHHFGDVGTGTPYVLIGPSKNRANILATGY